MRMKTKSRKAARNKVSSKAAMRQRSRQKESTACRLRHNRNPEMTASTNMAIRVMGRPLRSRRKLAGSQMR